MDKTKVFLIEYYNLADGVLLNKFKFNMQAGTVAQLKKNILQKLLAKQEIQPTHSLILKDNDDFQLASDDEVDVVLPDGKIKLYKRDSTTSLLPPTIVPSQIALSSPLLDLSKFKVPLTNPLAPNVMTMYCLQVRKAPISLSLPTLQLSYLQLSALIIKQLSLDPSLKAILYDDRGQPLLFNLDLMHRQLPRLNLARSFYVVFTKSPSHVDVPIPTQHTLNCKSITVLFLKEKLPLSIDLTNTVQLLKYKLFLLKQVHPLNQVIKFGGKVLSNEQLEAGGLSQGCILELEFKVKGNLNPSSFADKFYYKDVEHIHAQNDVAFLRSNLLALAAHLSQEDKLTFPLRIRHLTQDLPLACAMQCLLGGVFLSQAHRIALEEGLYSAIIQYLKQCKPALPITFKDVFAYVRDYFGYVLQTSVTSTAKKILINKQCYFTLKDIEEPRLIKLDNGQQVVVDYVSFLEQIQKGFTYDLLKEPKANMMVRSSLLQESFLLLKENQMDGQATNTLMVVGGEKDTFKVPVVKEANTYAKAIDEYPDMKVHQPLQIKSKNKAYLLMRTKDGKLLVYVSQNKDISKPHNLFDVKSGEEGAYNLDLLGANVKTENVEEVIDVANLKAVITREPKQAIVVLFDISGSMGGGFFNENSLQRIGAVKSFFQAFAFRTIAYNFQHVVSLIFFDNKMDTNCGFTQAIYDFNRLIAKASPRGSTLLYDAIVLATSQLIAFSKRYPKCLLRIVALTDGQDTGSSHSIEQAAQAVIRGQITMDSFAVGANCEGLKVVTKATGGKCYLTRSLEQSLKLFQQETVLSVRARKVDPLKADLSIEGKVSWAKAQPFDLANSVHQFKTAQISKPGVSAKEMIKQMQGEEQMKAISGNGALKRISREIQNYFDNPHPFVAIFPCSNINVWKVLLLGPKETPYYNGLFLLYVQFPGDYPFRAPQVRFTTPIYHCNMNAQGRICHSVFDRNYSPALSMRQIIDCVYGLILTPQPQDPLDNVVATFYLSDYKTYWANAEKATKEKAGMSVEKIVVELYGNINDDGERKKKEHQIQEWVNQAKNAN